MNYYPHHIGDFNNATRHLTRVERALYRELIELYYDTEKPLPADDFEWICKKVLAASETEKVMVQNLLGEFFILDGKAFRNDRCDEEISVFKSKHQSAVRAGRASAQRRANGKATRVHRSFTGRSTNVQPTKNQEPRTKNQEKKRAEATRGSRLPPDWRPSELLSAWAAKERPDLDVQGVVAKFRDFWAAKPGKAGLKLDWDATFRNWVREEKPGRQSQQQRIQVDL